MGNTARKLREDFNNSETATLISLGGGSIITAEKALVTQKVIPEAFCDLCSDHLEAAGAPRYAKQRATAECLNCNIALCQSCSKSHLANERLSKHKVLEYLNMLLTTEEEIEPVSRSTSVAKLQESSSKQTFWANVRNKTDAQMKTPGSTRSKDGGGGMFSSRYNSGAGVSSLASTPN